MEADAELVRRALARDQQAFAALYDRYADKLYDYSRRLTGNAADAADIVQDTFVLAIQRMHQLRDPSLVRPWLYAIARSEVHRRHRRVNRLQFTEPDEQAAMSSDAPTADDLVHQQELRTLFAEAANGLDPSDREVLDLHLRHSMTSAEIAASLGIPERQVSVVVQRVRERLGRSIGVVLLAKTPNCAELAALQRAEGSPMTVLSRKRLARHIEGCLTCSQQLSDRMRPEALLAAVPIALAPAFLRNGVLQRMADVANLAAAGNTGSGHARSNNSTSNNSTSNTSNSNTPDGGSTNGGSNNGGSTNGNGNGDATRSSRQAGRQSIGRSSSPQAALPSREGGRVWQESDGFPRPAPSPRRVVLAAIAAAAVLLLFVVAVVNGGDSAKRVAVGATTSFSERSLFPDDATSTSAPATPSPVITNVATTLAAGELPTTPVITAPPTVRPTGPPTPPTTTPTPTTPPTTATTTATTTAPTTTPTTTTPPTTAADTTAPAFQSAAASPSALSSADAALAPTCINPSATTSVITANVTDDRGVASVSVQYNAAGTPYNMSMTKVGNAWQVTIGPFPSAQVAPGLHQINAQFTATDTSGNTQAFNVANIATLLGCSVIL